MKENVGKLSVGLLLLVGVWIAVYTLWQPGEPPITFGSGPGNETHPPLPVQTPEPTSPLPTSVTTEQERGGPKPVTEIKASPAVVPPQFVQYTVKPGDTLQTISKQLYGTSAHAGAIARSNPFMDPSKLRPGRVIRAPRDPGNIQGRPRPGEPPAVVPVPLSQVQRYTVKTGDTLSGISQSVYGTVVHAGRIYEANTDKLRSPDDLRVGVELAIPPLDKPR